jgi:hypothetical protein
LLTRMGGQTTEAIHRAVRMGEGTLARTFSIETTLDPPSLLARVRRAARDNDATLVGDGRSGRFSHHLITGEYRMVGRTVVVAITDKPPIVPWAIIEARLRQLVG